MLLDIKCYRCMFLFLHFNIKIQFIVSTVALDFVEKNFVSF